VQQSPLAVFPSSHCSPTSTTPSPHVPAASAPIAVKISINGHTPATTHPLIPFTESALDQERLVA
jgi:hypothetical protein